MGALVICRVFRFASELPNTKKIHVSDDPEPAFVQIDSYEIEFLPWFHTLYNVFNTGYFKAELKRK